MSAAIPIRAALKAPLAESTEPVRLAECFKRTHYQIREHATLTRWAHAWWKYDGVRFAELDDEALTRDVYKFLDTVEVEKTNDKGETRRERVTARSRTANELQKALLSVMPMLGPNMPQWTMRYADDPPPERLVACANGLLDMKTLELVQPRTSTVPAAPSTRRRWPVLIVWVAVRVPTTAGMPNSRDTTAG